MRLLIILSLFIGSSVLAVDIPKGYQEAVIKECHFVMDQVFPKAPKRDVQSYCKCAVGHYINYLRKAKVVTERDMDLAISKAANLCNVQQFYKKKELPPL